MMRVEVVSNADADTTNYPKSKLAVNQTTGALYYRDADGNFVPIAMGAVVDGSALPTADPGVAGQLWNNAGVVTVSAG